MVRRGHVELMWDILKVMHNGEYKKTRIMYAANLSFQTLETWLNRLMYRDLIRKKGKYYYLTPLGEDTLKKLDDGIRELP